MDNQFHRLLAICQIAIQVSLFIFICVATRAGKCSAPEWGVGESECSGSRAKNKKSMDVSLAGIFWSAESSGFFL